MKKIILSSLFKALQIFLPFFLIVFSVALALAPIFIAFGSTGYWFLGLIVSIPLAITIVTMVNNFTDWDNLWEFSDVKLMISEYKNKIEKAKRLNTVQNDNQ
jgi:uncharacterized membrane protein (DUF106 family)